MGRKRKVTQISEEKENDKHLDIFSGKLSLLNNGPIYTIMSKVQLNETFHKKYIKDLKQIYEKVHCFIINILSQL